MIMSDYSNARRRSRNSPARVLSRCNGKTAIVPYSVNAVLLLSVAAENYFGEEKKPIKTIGFFTVYGDSGDK